MPTYYFYISPTGLRNHHAFCTTYNKRCTALDSSQRTRKKPASGCPESSVRVANGHDDRRGEAIVEPCETRFGRAHEASGSCFTSHLATRKLALTRTTLSSRWRASFVFLFSRLNITAIRYQLVAPTCLAALRYDRSRDDHKHDFPYQCPWESRGSERSWWTGRMRVSGCRPTCTRER
ncbi:hypothetical protein PYCCODRAFT_437363 [Trametes coccinea BRFM310]|uniref:Uncharacterized protein n=1 Tax=Trametes coccinea (strain BRFM310) TaxID=1353009 RepID=A0A1Y2ILR6_TRAC3|nr:hypothetical protein PYCCODRAFT_437363 [Trametes coccinea BRFM310]